MSGAISVHHGAFGRAAVYRLDRPIIPHAHREGHLVFYAAGATAQVRLGDMTFPVDATHAVAVSPWEPHSFEVVDPSEPCICLVLYIKPLWFLETSQSATFALSFGRPEIEMTEPVQRWATRLTSLLLDECASDRFDGFLFETARACHEQSWDGVEEPPIQRLCARYTDFRVRKSMRLMAERFAEEIAMERIARDVGLSRPHFFKLFKQQMGISPNLYVNTLRAEQAIEDLMTTRKTVTDIGFDLGFSSQASFTRFFASNVGIPPTEYRRVAHIV